MAPPRATPDFVETSLTGLGLLSTPIFNKGTAFTEAERDAFELHGLLPPHVATLAGDHQVLSSAAAPQKPPQNPANIATVNAQRLSARPGPVGQPWDGGEERRAGAFGG